MIALLRDYLRRSWLLGILASGAVFGFLCFSCRVFLQIQQRGGASPLTKLVPQWVQTAFNINTASMSDLNGFLSVMFQHPFVMTVLLGMPVALITGFITGDVEKRTIALILARPIGRLQIIGSVAVVIVFWVAVSLVFVWAGCKAGAAWTGQSASLTNSTLTQACFALSLLIFAFTGIAAALSSMLSVRGDAVGWSLTIVLTMYVWNFLAQVWSGGVGLANYSLFRYYQPTGILLNNANPAHNLLILFSVGMIGWIFSGLVFRFRSFSV